MSATTPLQYVPVCHACAGAKREYPRPASYTHFNHHPMGACRLYHPESIRFVYGCAIHRGPLDQYNNCPLCLHGGYAPTPLQNTTGYPGDQYM